MYNKKFIPQNFIQLFFIFFVHDLLRRQNYEWLGPVIIT